MSIINTELMPFKKFVQMRGITFQENKIRICGTFKEKVTGDICKCDEFNAYNVGRSIEETYKLYLDWWNHIKYDHEYGREFISVKLVKGVMENGKKGTIS